jgi:predicted small secreted protein
MTTRTLHTKRTILAILIVAVTTLGGCNTVQGVGKDVEAVGDKTQEAAQKASDKL